MPHPCVVCGERDFEESSGLYFCTTCQTQSQDYREEDAEAEYDEVDMRYGRLNIPLATVTPAASTDTKPHVDGRPWRTCEGFTILIREQVRAIKLMGAKPEFQDIVLKLWALYLSKTGTAFHSLVPEDEKSYPAVRHERDEQLLTLEQPRVTANRRIRRTKRTRGGVLSNKQAQLNEEKKQMLEMLSKEDFYEEDDPFTADDEAIRQLNPALKSDDMARRTLKHNVHHQVNYMTYVRCAVFPFLGLLFTHNLTIAADYVRWIEAGKIPYEDLSSKFPADMKFFNVDQKVFSKDRTVMKTHILRQEAGMMLRFLDREDLRLPDVNVYCARLVCQLNLPREIQYHVTSVLRSRELPLRVVERHCLSSLVARELFAMATIVIVLKLLFGLDGRKEIELSNYAREVNETKCLEKQLFELDFWLRVSHLSMKETTNIFNGNPLDACAVRDMGEALRSYKQLHGGEKHHSQRMSYYPQRRRARQQIGHMLRSCTDPDDPSDGDSDVSDDSTGTDDVIVPLVKPRHETEGEEETDSSEMSDEKRKEASAERMNKKADGQICETSDGQMDKTSEEHLNESDSDQNSEHSNGQMKESLSTSNSSRDSDGSIDESSNEPMKVSPVVQTNGSSSVQTDDSSDSNMNEANDSLENEVTDDKKIDKEQREISSVEGDNTSVGIRDSTQSDSEFIDDISIAEEPDSNTETSATDQMTSAKAAELKQSQIRSEALLKVNANIGGVKTKKKKGIVREEFIHFPLQTVSTEKFAGDSSDNDSDDFDLEDASASLFSDMTLNTTKSRSSVYATFNPSALRNLESIHNNFSDQILSYVVGNDLKQFKKPESIVIDSDIDEIKKQSNGKTKSHSPFEQQNSVPFNPIPHELTEAKYWLNRENKRVTLPTCYTSLITLCSRVLLCTTEELNRYVDLVEQYLLVGGEHRTFAKRYFDDEYAEYEGNVD